MTSCGALILLLIFQNVTAQLDLLSGISRLFQSGVNQNPTNNIQGGGNQLINNRVEVESFAQNGQRTEACIPYIGELAKLFWGNCKQQADARTWLAWSKTIRDAFDSGRITLDNAMKETCRLNAEKDTCETMGRRLAQCDVFGVIHAAVQMSQSQQRCERIKNFIFQPQNGVENAGQFVGNEVVGGLVRRFLFGQQ